MEDDYHLDFDALLQRARELAQELIGVQLRIASHTMALPGEFLPPQGLDCVNRECQLFMHASSGDDGPQSHVIWRPGEAFHKPPILSP